MMDFRVSLYLKEGLQCLKGLTTLVSGDFCGPFIIH